MTNSTAVILIGVNIVLLFLLMGFPFGVVEFRRSVLVKAPRGRLWGALWPLGDHAGWSGHLISAEAAGENRIAARLSWEARDGSAVTHLMEVSEREDGERFTVRVIDDNTLDHSFWRHYARTVSLADTDDGTLVTVTMCDAYRGAAFMLFRYFALRRELSKLKIWAETGAYRAGGIVEHPVTQFVSAGLSTVIFWAMFGFNLQGFMLAFLLTLVIVLHELGHMAAFRLMGHRHVRMIFVPVLGGLAVGGRPYNSHYEIAFSALMGAGFSAFLVPLAMAGYVAAHATGNPVLAHWALLFGGFCALFNLANLLPVWKFDGGQVLRQLFDRETTLALVSFSLLGAFLALGWAAGISLQVLLLIGVVVALLSLLTKGRRIRPRHALVPISSRERGLMIAALLAVTLTHASGLVWAARSLFG